MRRQRGPGLQANHTEEKELPNSKQTVRIHNGKRKNHFHLNPCVKKNTKKNSHAYVMRDNQQSPVN